MEALASLRAENANWNLSSDQKLLDALELLSKRIAEKSHDCIKKVNDLGAEVGESEAGLRNTFNEFLMLGNSQFIENVSRLAKPQNNLAFKVDSTESIR
jgi:hypothetical protein